MRIAPVTGSLIAERRVDFDTPSTLAAGASGLLTHVLPGWTTGDAKLTLVTLSRRGQLPAIRALVDFLVAEYPGAVEAL